jgi:hypothetical protein
MRYNIIRVGFSLAETHSAPTPTAPFSGDRHEIA